MPRSIARVERRGDVFYFRMAVPKQWVSTVGKREIKLSLRTCKPTKSRLRGRALSNAMDVLFDGLQYLPSVSPQVIKERSRISFQRLLHREMHAKRSRGTKYWGRSHFSEICRCFGCSGQETDLLAIFESATGLRFALHVEVKQPNDKFKDDGQQAAAYPVRAQCWATDGTRPAKVLPRTEAWRRLAGGNAAVVSNVARMLADAPKDRSSDYLICCARSHPSMAGVSQRLESMPVHVRIDMAADAILPANVRATAARFASGIEWGRERQVVRPAA